MTIKTTATTAAAVLFAALVAPASGAWAQDVTPLGTFEAWEAYTYKEDGHKVCYQVSEPKKSEGDYTRRGRTYVMVTHRPANGNTNVVSVIAGYTYKKDSDVSVNIGGHTFTLFTHEDSAWAADSEADRSLVRAMKRGVDMVVKGRSTHDTLTTDTYSLMGFTAAHEAINKACNVDPL